MTDLDAYLDGERVGTFTMSRAGRVDFRYTEPDSDQDSTPISMSMPRARNNWGPRNALPYLAGLLPDSPERLRDLAARFRTSEHPFRLLEHVGRDAAGAVQLIASGEDAPDAATQVGDVERLSDDDVSELLRSLTSAPDTWGHDEFGGRWSLAGAQTKVALFRFDDGAWGVPHDSTPTTHILKPAIAALPDHDVNEVVTMSAARRLGLDVAEHELLHTRNAERVFVAERYDRRRGNDRWHRLHQEDLCQSLSVDPSRKYQEQGGPSAGQIARLFREGIEAADQRQSVQRAFYEALVFNCAAQNTDAHAKNYSLMLDGARVRMAPLYDLASHAAYPTRNGSSLLSAMSIGNEYRFDAIGLASFRKVGKSLGLSDDESVSRFERITGGVAGAFDAAANEIDEPFARTLADAVAENAHRRGW